jgi:hypothetical protein
MGLWGKYFYKYMLNKYTLTQKHHGFYHCVCFASCLAVCANNWSVTFFKLPCSQWDSNPHTPALTLHLIATPGKIWADKHKLGQNANIIELIW